MADAPEEGLAVVADRQNAGKGRHGRPWASPVGGLYLSVLLHPPREGAHLLTLLSANAPLRACALMGFQLQIKWPNDLMVQGAKVGGVLGEGVHQSGRYSLILGVGLNSNIPVDSLPRLEEGQAISLRVLRGEPVDNEVLLQHLLRELDDLYALFRSGGDQELLREYRQFCSTLGQRVEARTPKGRLVGTALDISREGLLILEDEDGEVHELADATVRPLE